MRLKLQKLWQLRPRVLTVALVAIVGAMIVLANLTDEFRRCGQEPFVGNGQLRFSLQNVAPIELNGSNFGNWSISYGWPLLWRQYIIGISPGPSVVTGECCSGGRFGANMVIWCIMLAATAAACEWALCRRRRGFHWSLRAMLAGVALAAAFCGWFATAHGRAGIQDPVANTNRVWFKRWGPRWLDLVGGDRYRRTIVGAWADLTPAFTSATEANEVDLQAKQDTLARLARLRELKYLFIEVDGHPIPGLPVDLRKMSQLRALSIHMDDGFNYYGGQRFSREGKRWAHECLEAIGAMTNLEHLSLSGMPITSETLACLGNLTKLKSLLLQVNRNVDEKGPGSPLLSRLPPLPQLETLYLEDSYVGDRGLRYLSVLPRLKTLHLSFVNTIDYDPADFPRLTFDPGVVELAGLRFLEQVTVLGDMSSAAGLESLSALKHLTKLHLAGFVIAEHSTSMLPLDQGEEVEVLAVEVDRCRRALEVLRQANPGIVIDSDSGATKWREKRLIPAEYEDSEEVLRAVARNLLDDWRRLKKGRG